MQVSFYATLRQAIGQKTVEFPLPEGSSVRQLLHSVIERYPEMNKELFDENGELYGHVHVFINGRDAPYLENGLETILTSQDKVDIFPPVAGG